MAEMSLDDAIELFRAEQATAAWLCKQAEVEYPKIVLYYFYHRLLEWEREEGRGRYSLTGKEMRELLKESISWRWRKVLGERLREKADAG